MHSPTHITCTRSFAVFVNTGSCCTYKSNMLKKINTKWLVVTYTPAKSHTYGFLHTYPPTHTLTHAHALACSINSIGISSASCMLQYTGCYRLSQWHSTFWLATSKFTIRHLFDLCRSRTSGCATQLHNKGHQTVATSSAARRSHSNSCQVPLKFTLI